MLTLPRVTFPATLGAHHFDALKYPNGNRAQASIGQNPEAAPEARRGAGYLSADGDD
jgi:hypothetical protein